MESNSTPMDAQSGAAAPASMSERRAWHGNDLRLQSIFDASPAIVFVVDKDNRFVFVNHAWERVFGKTLQQVAGQPVAEIFSEANARAMAEENRRALDVRTPVESEQVVRVGGSPRTFTTSRMALVDENGSPVGVCGVAVDITERKRGENRLRFLAKVASALVVRGDDVDGLMGELCRMLEGELGGDVYFHYRPEGINPRLHLSSYGGIHVSVGQTLEWLDFGAAVCGTVAVTQQPWVIDDVRNSRCAQQRRPAHAIDPRSGDCRLHVLSTAEQRHLARHGVAGPAQREIWRGRGGNDAYRGGPGLGRARSLETCSRANRG
jgi:PAS domain S-box-containing protein